MPDERFLTLEAVRRELSLSIDEVLLLITGGQLPAIHLLGSWRVERIVLEQFIARLYTDNTYMLPIHTALNLTEGDHVPQVANGTAKTSYEASDVPLPILTPQLSRVLELVAHGLSNAEIASELTLGVSTVKSHVSRLLSRLGVRNREGLIAYAWRSGLIHRGE
jgi:DNA-binding NarL/FixJ family response regulator